MWRRILVCGALVQSAAINIDTNEVTNDELLHLASTKIHKE